MVNSISIKDLINLNGRTAVVTGSTGNLGCHIAASLAELGADLILTDRQGSDYSQVIEIINSYSNAISYHVIDCDLENEESRNELIKNIDERIERLHILINNAGTNIPEHFLKVKTSNMEHLVKINTIAAFNIAQLVSLKMLKTKNKQKIFSRYFT